MSRFAMGGLARPYGINSEGMKCLPEVRDRVREVLLDSKLRRFLERYRPNIYKRLCMFNSLMCYTYLVDLQKSIEEECPKVGKTYVPESIEEIIQTIIAIQELYPLYNKP